MKRTIAVLVLVTALVGSGFGFRHKKSKPPEDIDQNYISALASAERFLFAWQTRDASDGLALLSNRLRAAHQTSFLQHYIIGDENPAHAAFEISNGKKLPDGRYAFEVRLFENQRGEFWQGKRPKPSRIVMAASDLDRWLVDELP
jgi:hypothetical protein